MRRFYRLVSAVKPIDMPYWFAKKEQSWSHATDKPVRYRNNYYKSYYYTIDTVKYLTITSINRVDSVYEAIFFKLKAGDLTNVITVTDLLSERINPEFDTEETVDQFINKVRIDSAKKLYS